MKKEKEKEKEKKKKKERRAIEWYVPSEEQTAKSGRNRESETDAKALEKIVALVGGKWKMRILWTLRDGQGKRYSTIKLAMPSITDMMLSQSLRELCESGLLARRQYQEIPPRVEYVMTPAGAQIIPALRQLIEWAGNLTQEPVKRNNP